MHTRMFLWYLLSNYKVLLLYKCFALISSCLIYMLSKVGFIYLTMHLIILYRPALDNGY